MPAQNQSTALISRQEPGLISSGVEGHMLADGGDDGVLLFSNPRSKTDRVNAGLGRTVVSCHRSPTSSQTR